jgi:hypothetical protein
MVAHSSPLWLVESTSIERALQDWGEFVEYRWIL